MRTKFIEARFGLRSKPATLRFRLLDRSQTLGGLRDVQAPVQDLLNVDLHVRKVFVTENEVKAAAVGTD